MRTSSRALIGFGVGIAVLVILTFILVFTLGQGNPSVFSENTPEGVVQRYLIAVQEKDYPLAYRYLAPPDQYSPDYIKGSPPLTYDNWIMTNQYSRSVRDSTWKAGMGKVSVSGETASVEIMIDHFRPGGPFGNSVETSNIAFFLKMVASNWRITSPIDLYWLY